MKKTLNIDDSLLAAAKGACGATTDTETVHKGLEALVRSAAYQRLQSYLGTEPHAKDVPRRRQKTAA
jgi:Arc/MetJ family transcription regulator